LKCHSGIEKIKREAAYGMAHVCYRASSAPPPSASRCPEAEAEIIQEAIVGSTSGNALPVHRHALR